MSIYIWISRQNFSGNFTVSIYRKLRLCYRIYALVLPLGVSLFNLAIHLTLIEICLASLSSHLALLRIITVLISSCPEVIDGLRSNNGWLLNACQIENEFLKGVG